ncbi:MAG: Crp/Fnr family transcriptional regulator [Christensenellales bacterium]
MAEHVVPILKKASLFKGLTKDEITLIWGCLNARTASFTKGSYLLFAGDAVNEVGILLEGRAEIFREDVMGNRSVISSLESGEMFAEALASATVEHSPVSVLAVSNCTAVFFSIDRIAGHCANACVFHSRVVANLMRVLAQKNIILTQKLDILSKRTTREKLLAYLMEQSMNAGSKMFQIPFDRNTLADYLGVNRSAMSRELSALREDGLIDFHKNSFKLTLNQNEADKNDIKKK